MRDVLSDRDSCGMETFESETGDSLFDEDEVRSKGDDSEDEFGEVVCFLSDGGVEDDELALDARVVERELEEHDPRADVVARHGLGEGRKKERNDQHWRRVWSSARWRTHFVSESLGDNDSVDDWGRNRKEDQWVKS